MIRVNINHSIKSRAGYSRYPSPSKKPIDQNSIFTYLGVRCDMCSIWFFLCLCYWYPVKFLQCNCCSENFAVQLLTVWLIKTYVAPCTIACRSENWSSVTAASQTWTSFSWPAVWIEIWITLHIMLFHFLFPCLLALALVDEVEEEEVRLDGGLCNLTTVGRRWFDARDEKSRKGW